MIDLGKLAYEAFREERGVRSLTAFPEWEDLDEKLKACWDAAAQAVAAQLLGGE